MARPKVKATYNTTENKLTCTCCGKIGGKEAFFSHRNPYLNSSLSICKECVHVDEDDLESVLELLRFLNIPFYKNRWDGLKEKSIGLYLRQLAMTKDKYFKDSDMFTTKVLIEDLDKKTTISAQTTETNEPILTKDELKAQEDVKRLLGYDPYEGYPIEDQKYLYNNLLIYLNEDTLEDGIKLSAYLQIVNNNNQIRKLDFAISSLNSDIKSMVENAKDINTLQDVKSKIVTSNDKIMKENSISVKNRGDKKAGRSTLTYMMRDLRELDFEEAEEDYYDQRKAYGMQLVADISNKSLLEQLSLDENNYVDIIKTQREKLQASESKIDELTEENRNLYVQVDELKSKIIK